MFFYSLLATTLSIPIPQGSGALTAVDNPVTYLNAIYLYVVGISGVFALLIMVYSGVEYILSAGRPALQEAARHRITRTIFGLLLLFSAVLILNVIDPDLKKIELLNVESVKKISQEGAAYSGTYCKELLDDIQQKKQLLTNSAKPDSVDKSQLTNKDVESLQDVVDALSSKRDDLLADPDLGTLQERSDVAVQLNKAQQKLEDAQNQIAHGDVVLLNRKDVEDSLKRLEDHLADLRAKGFCK